MSVWYKTLFTLSVMHEYYGGVCPDFEFLLPDSTRKLARNGRLLFKQKENTAYCLYEADETGGAFKPLNGETVRIALKLRNPNFKNFTESDFGGLAALYRNLNAPDHLDSPLGVQLAGLIIRHAITKNTRSVTLSLENAAGTALQTDQISSENVFQHSFLTGGLKDNGVFSSRYYTVRETYPATTGQTHYYVDSELLSAGVFGVAEIRLKSGFYALPPAFEIAFTAKKQRLKYYVVARKYGDSDFAKLAVSDEGFGEDQRNEVKFTRVASPNFTTDDLSPSLIGTGKDKITLFKSNTVHARQAKARRKIQLKSNDDVLIQHLPTPTEHQAQADLIIHVAKP